MAQTAHTPAPWFAKTDNRRWTPNHIEAAHAHIADVMPCGINKKADPEATANARLIAAAPDMLAALHALLGADIYADGEGLVSFAYPNTEDGDAAKALALAAIAKATGGANA